jgi:hypothetical protein
VCADKGIKIDKVSLSAANDRLNDFGNYVGSISADAPGSPATFAGINRWKDHQAFDSHLAAALGHRSYPKIRLWVSIWQ